MQRRDFLKSTAAGAAGASLFSRSLNAASDRPNVLFILVDQMRKPRWTRPGITPHIDRLAGQGLTFDNCFISASPCSPSRACIMTGTDTTQNKMYTNCDFVEGELQPSLDPSIPTFGQVFGKAGYHTPYRGKWHLTRRTDRNDKDPLLDYGFTGWNPPEAFFGGPPYCGRLFDPMYAGQACNWLRENAGKQKPWFLVCSLVNPHDICAYPRYYPQQKLKPIMHDEPPENWTDDLSGKPSVHREFQQRYNEVGGNMDVTDADQWRRYLDFYAYCLNIVDEQIGRVLDALERSGQADNTLVVFTSDHGEMAGSHRLRAKGNYAYEEVMNVPLIFSWPGKIPQGSKTGAMAASIDIMPTLAAAAGIGPDIYMPGVDLSPVLHDPSKNSDRSEVLYHVDWESDFTVGKDKDQHSIYDNPSHVRGVREKHWKYAYYFSPGLDKVEHELYNLKDDPLEMKNLANDPGHQKRVKQMHEHMVEWERHNHLEFKNFHPEAEPDWILEDV